MKKMLMLASVASMIDQFNIPNIEILQEQGYEVHVACNFEKGSTCSAEQINELKKLLSKMDVQYFQIDFSRNVLKINEVLKAYQQMKKLCVQERYDFIHCHSPIGGVIGRLAGHATYTKVIYTAHGFHFFKGAPLINWIIFYPIEKWLARYTDVLITLNQEDYERAKKFKAKKVEYIPGVGVDLKKFRPADGDRDEIRKEFGIAEDDIVLLSVGELIKRKNHKVVIQALQKVENKKVIYCICGQGPLKNELQQLAERCHVADRVYFMGFRNDIANMCVMSDVFLFPSLQEGLSMALMEAMACGLPVICSDIRGNNELVIENASGYRVTANNVVEFSQKIISLTENKRRCQQCGEYNRNFVKNFGIDKVNEKMERIYEIIEE